MYKKNVILSLFLVSISALIVFAVTSQNSPLACAGQWSSCANAFADDASRATFTATNTLNGSGRWNDYGFSIPNSAQIDGVKVRADFFASNVRGFIGVRVSGDGGLTYGPSHVVGGNTAEQTFNIDITSDLSWTPQTLNNSNFRVNVTCFKSPASSSNPTCRLDWIPVNVSYTQFDFSLSASPNSASVAQSTSAQTAVSVTLLGGVSQNVALSTPNCPTGAICSFSPPNGNPTFTSNFTVSTSSSTPAGTYTINITGSGDGKVRAALYTLNVTDSSPTASASANPSSGIEPLTVNFTGTVTGGDAPINYFWNFTDGGTSTQQNPQHNFNAGTFNVSFTATDFDGDESTGHVLVTVDADTSPTANPSEAPTKGNIPLQVNFNGSFSGGNPPFTYLWDFNDSTTSTLQNPKHNFTVLGIYNVAFTVTDTNGNFSTGFGLINATAPDLIVDSIVFGEYLVNISEVRVNVNTTVKNIGNGNSGVSTTRVSYVDSTINYFTNSLTAGASITITRDYNCSASHTVNSTADVNNVISESNEVNNFLGGVFIDCVM